MNDFVLAGSYAPAADQGIRVLRFDGATGTLFHHAGFSGVENPSFLEVADGGRLVFAVSETEDGAVVSLGVDLAAGRLWEINRRSTNGSFPCHLRFDSATRSLWAVNYGSGSVCRFPVREDGSLGPMIGFAKHFGSGPRADRQEAAHAHMVDRIPGTELFLVTDLGTDGLYVYAGDSFQHTGGESAPAPNSEETDGERDRAALRLVQRVAAPAGSGPRHVAFSPDGSRMYVAGELDSTVAVYAVDREATDFTGGKVSSGVGLRRLQTISSLPDGFTGSNTAADIHVDEKGEYLYISNRGHDSIATFRVTADGSLRPAGWTPSGGRTPRNFTLGPGGRHVLVANQDSDTIAVWERDEAGLPSRARAQWTMPKPVCLRVVRLSGHH
ncbi:MAG: lactonase family protein [Alicyclobacillus sp.]|nr:lactonase family protein [Alicyclobacillus sp.]